MFWYYGLPQIVAYQRADTQCSVYVNEGMTRAECVKVYRQAYLDGAR